MGKKIIATVLKLGFNYKNKVTKQFKTTEHLPKKKVSFLMLISIKYGKRENEQNQTKKNHP